MSFYVKTPLLKHSFNGRIDSTPQFYLKYECLQPAGSFKSRGIGYLISCEVEKAKAEGSKIHVYASSGGNAGLAAAVASKTAGTSCTVVVPSSTKRHMVAKIEQAGATVILHGENWQNADDYLTEIIMKDLPDDVKPLYVHPFDNDQIWEGHSSMVDEILQQLLEEKKSLSDVKGIVCSVGGGGLYNGVISGLERHGLAEKIPVIAVETVGADAMGRSLIAGKAVKLNEIKSVASSLGSSYVAQDSLEKAIKYKTRCLAQEDRVAIETCFKFLTEKNMLVEPACAVSLSLCYDVGALENLLNSKLTQNDIIIVIVCGGSVTTISDLESLRKNLVTCD